MLDWIIVGAGVHGVHLAHQLLSVGRVSRDRLLLVDRSGAPLTRWRFHSERCGMRYLRSPVVHHLGGRFDELWRFAAASGDPDFAPPYALPSLPLFNAHADSIVRELGLDERTRPATVRRLKLEATHVSVDTDEGQLDAKRVVLAPGGTDVLELPAWSRGLQRVSHMFAPTTVPPEGPIVVVGGGISAVQVALLTARDRPGEVTLLSREPLRVRQFDADAGWMGPKLLAEFVATSDPVRRRHRIAEARFTGSVPHDVVRELKARQESGEIIHQIGEVRSASETNDDVTLQLADGTAVNASGVLLATGFEPRRPGGALIDALVEEDGLPVAPCGWPLVDGCLRWHPRVHVSGGLAELELGPVARNIVGARRAAERVLDAVAAA